MQAIEDKTGPVLGYRAVSLLTVLLLVLQPILIGQYLYAHPGEDSWKDAHAIVGNIAHLTVLVQLVLAFLARRTLGIGLGIYNVVLLALVIIQGGLGASDSGDSTAIHVPLGTFLLSLSCFAAFLAWFDLRRQRRITPPD